MARRRCRRSAWTCRARPISSRKSAGTGASTGSRPRSPRCATMPRAVGARRRARPRACAGCSAAPACRRRCTFTFIEAARGGAVRGAPTTLVTIANPLSEKFAVLRPSLLPGLLDALVYSRRREIVDVRLFEVGRGVRARRASDVRVGWVLTGPRGDHWSGGAGDRRLHRREGRRRAARRGVRRARSTSAPADDLPWLVARPARARSSSARHARPDGSAGSRGHAASRPTTPVFAGEIDLAALAARRRGAPHGRSRRCRDYPSIVRDLSMLVDERLPAAEVRGTIRTNAPATLVRCASSIGIRARACRTGRSACRCG